MIKNRIDDKMKIFNKQWEANHNKKLEKEIGERQNFIKNIYGLDKKPPKSNYINPEQRACNLQNSINNSFNGYKATNRNNISGNYK